LRASVDAAAHRRLRVIFDDFGADCWLVDVRSCPYSRLMGEDEAGTAKIVRERREAATPIVRSFGGPLVKTMGDGVLLEFPSSSRQSNARSRSKR
jgi:class 3 adenylate cyclase